MGANSGTVDYSNLCMQYIGAQLKVCYANGKPVKCSYGTNCIKNHASLNILDKDLLSAAIQTIKINYDLKKKVTVALANRK